MTISGELCCVALPFRCLLLLPCLSQHLFDWSFMHVYSTFVNVLTSPPIFFWREESTVLTSIFLGYGQMVFCTCGLYTTWGSEYNVPSGEPVAFCGRWPWIHWYLGTSISPQHVHLSPLLATHQKIIQNEEEDFWEQATYWTHMYLWIVDKSSTFCVGRLVTGRYIL